MKNKFKEKISPIIHKYEGNLSKLKYNLKQHIFGLLFFLISTIIMSIIIYAFLLFSHIDYLDSQINNNIVEYNEIDREQLCKLSNCSMVEIPNEQKLFNLNNKKHLIFEPYIETKNIKLFKNLYFDDNLNFKIFDKKSSTYYYINKKYLQFFSNLTLFFIISIFLIFLGVFFRIVTNEQNKSMMSISSNEAVLTNKSVVVITENIHHELNTPLDVIDNKIEKIRRLLLKKDKKKYSEISNDFDQIKMSSEMIHNLLDKMKKFKTIKYSNGNKTIYDIIDGAFSLINIRNLDFEYEIDDKFNLYGLKILKNVDLLNIFMNHFKNSLEAGATKIFLKFISFTDDTITLRIIDNGNGMSDKIKKRVFEKNFSSKIDINSVRGNGMFISRQILKEHEGNVIVASSSKNGTTIEIKLKSFEKFSCKIDISKGMVDV